MSPKNLSPLALELQENAPHPSFQRDSSAQTHSKKPVETESSSLLLLSFSKLSYAKSLNNRKEHAQPWCVHRLLLDLSKIRVLHRAFKAKIAHLPTTPTPHQCDWAFRFHTRTQTLSLTRKLMFLVKISFPFLESRKKEEMKKSRNFFFLLVKEKYSDTFSAWPRLVSHNRKILASVGVNIKIYWPVE